MNMDTYARARSLQDQIERMTCPQQINSYLYNMAAFYDSQPELEVMKSKQEYLESASMRWINELEDMRAELASLTGGK